MRSWLAIGCFVLAFTACGATAQQGDGLYHRFDGDVSLTGGIAGGIHWEEARGTPSALVLGELHARYLESAGMLLGVEHVADRHTGILTGVEVRPVFLARFFTNAFTGHRWLDLAVDSFALEMGAWLGPVDHGPAGAALLLGVGIELPVWVEGRHRLGFALGWRYVHSHSDDQRGVPTGVSGTRVLASLVFTTSVESGMSGWEPPLYRP